MGLIDQAKKDANLIMSDPNGFGVLMTFTAPTGETAAIHGLHTKIHMGIDTDGNVVNSKKATISFPEKALIDLSYPVRISGKVFLKGHKVAVADSTGANAIYIIAENFPDETIGAIVCFLQDFE